ncbi:CotH kinase family protein [Microlunatus flavus]|uniref:CotH protein n=1 Tax=Microlunatus flavus TaxID=1036181 RepID=A0A1H9CA57_9ACTN|nr:CotH kinase family protein [Microlunatus flavus]SEP98145.1 CotH protein [Microlunatus flavus]
MGRGRGRGLLVAVAVGAVVGAGAMVDGAAAAGPAIGLDAIRSNSSGTQASATAHVTPAKKGATVRLQALTLVTTNTDEVTKPTWKTLDTAKEDAQGEVTFALDDPLEVEHRYRAVTGSDDQVVSNEVTFAAPATTKRTGLSTVYLNTNEGHSINTRKRYFEGQFTMTASSALPRCTAVPTQSHVIAKGRGNYSWTFAKKSFTVKLDAKTDLCGMGKSKKWALIANAYDRSLLRESAAFDLGSKLTNLGWTPRSAPVDLYVNGSYRGSYLLVERITIADDRVAIDELVNGSEDPTGANDREPNVTGGYLLEWDFRHDADHNVHAGRRGWVGIKEPEDEDDGTGITKKQVSYVNSYLDATDKALYGSSWKSDTKGWKAYIDEKSAVDYYLAQELTKPVDGNMWASVYMYKPRGGKLHFGPMWDYDLAEGSARRAGGTVSPTGWYLKNPVATSAKQSSSTWFNRLNDDPDFRRAVRARWKEVYPQLKGEDAFLAAQRTVIARSADANFDKWSVKSHLSKAQVVKGSWSKEVSYLRGWLKKRISWMDDQYR